MHVQGGTDAGRKPPFDGQPEPWECDCPAEVVAEGVTAAKENPGYLRNCPDCGCRRPD